MSSLRQIRKHSEEFKQEAVRLALESGQPKSHIARDLNISDGLLYAWISKYDEAKSKGLTPAEHQAEKDELRKLKAELKQLKLENDILKKAAGYFARNQL
ncbi:MAG: transposase [Proteobacteria bacterium]|nr:transposase [Pseudomonadota bacterium]